MPENWFLFAVLFALSAGLDLPPEFITCKRSDPNLDQCMQKAIETALPILANGIPSLGIEPCYPLRVSGFTIGEGSGVVHVKQNYKNVEIYNIVNGTVSNVEAKIDDPKIHVKFDCYFPELRMEADYEANGRILLLPIVGKGKCTLKILKVKVTFDIKSEVFNKKGTEYIKLNELTIKMDPKGAHFSLGNLFDGDRRLGDELNAVLNDNSLDVLNDVKSGYEEVFAAIFKRVINSVFTRIPYDKTFPV